MRTFLPRLYFSRCPALWICLLLVSLGVALPAHAKGPRHHQSKPVVRAIEQQEAKWLAAQISGNASTLSSMMAEDYLGISPNGTLQSKAETLAAFKSGAIHLTAITPSEKKIRIYGSTAVVVCRAAVTGTSNGRDISGHYRYTRVYHNNGGIWKIVSFEANRIQDRASRNAATNAGELSAKTKPATP